MKLSYTGPVKTLLGALITASVAASPLIAFAQTVSNIPSLFSYALGILNGYVVPIIFAIAFIMFIWGVYTYFIQNGGNAEKVQEGQKFVLWSVIGFVVMFSIWGIINLFINTLGFGTSAQPAFPTFNAPTNTSSLTSGSLTNSISCLFGNCGTSSTAASTNSTLGSVGSTFTDSSGVTYTVTGANSVAPVSGNCPSGWSLAGSLCLNSGSSSVSGTSAISGIPNGSACTISASSPDGNCEGALICSNGTCQPDPSLENGNGTLNSACVPPGDCDGDMICDTNSDTCQNPNTPGVSDGTGATGNGNGSLGSQCVPPGDCDGDMVCDVNSDTCEEPSTTGVSDGSGATANGNGTQGSACVPPGDCDGSLVCDVNSDTCEDPNSANVNDGSAADNGGTTNYSGDNSGGSVPSNGNTGS